MTPYRWLLFDLDGTLFDYNRGERAALEAAWVESGQALEPALMATYRRVNGALWQAYENGAISQLALRVERFARLLDELGRDGDPSALSGIYLDLLARQIWLIDGARRLLDDVADRFRLGLITNGIPEVQRPRIERSGLGALFPVVVISGEEGVAKPAPEIFEVAFERMGAPARSEVLLIGDSLSSDIAGGAAYGIDTCWFNPAARALDGAVRPRYEIARLGELSALLG